MKNLKEQYERYFGKLTERARTSDSDVKTIVKNDKPGRPIKAEDLLFIMKDGDLSDKQMVMAAIRGRSEGDRMALRELDRYYKKYSDEKKGFL